MNNHVAEVTGRMAELATANSRTISMLEAPAMVLEKSHEAVFLHLTLLQRAEVARSFRNGIEDPVALMDDLALPAEYNSTLLALTNLAITPFSATKPGNLAYVMINARERWRANSRRRSELGSRRRSRQANFRMPDYASVLA